MRRRAADRRPWRVALTARAAITVGSVLIAVGLVLAVRALVTGAGTAVPAVGQTAAGAQEAGASGTSRAGPSSGASTAPGRSTAGPTDPLASPPAGEGVVVHVTGAVTEPGVVTLAAGARVVDAIAAAGGALPEADLARLNLARLLADGEQLYLPRQGEEVADSPAGAGTWSTSADGAAAAGGTAGEASGEARRSARSAQAAQSGSGAVSINQAGAKELESLPGIGPALAQRIVDHRAEHGPFASVDQLREVPGIGEAKLAALRELVTL